MSMCPIMALAALLGGDGPVLPAQHGQMVVSHRPAIDDSDHLQADAPVLTLLDISLPGLDGLWPTPGTPWSIPLDSNLDDPDHAWTLEQLGLIGGLTCLPMDHPDPGLYVAASPLAYGDFSADPLAAGPEGPGGIHRISLETGAISTLVPGGLPNGGPGLGGLCWDDDHQQLIVANFDDGRVYLLGEDGVLQSMFDPFDSAQAANGLFAPLGDRIIAVAYHAQRLYFSTWLRDAGRPDTPWPASAGPEPTDPDNAIWSVAVDEDGAITEAPVLEFTLPRRDGRTWTHPAWDIDFDASGHMFVTQRTCHGDIGSPDMPSQAGVLEYTFADYTWSPSSQLWHVGQATTAEGAALNAAGGIAIDCNGHAWVATSDVLGGQPGVTRLPAPGNTHDTRVITSLPVPMPELVMGDIERIGPGGCGTKQGACCLEHLDDPTTCVQVTWDECVEAYGGIWNGLGALCSEVHCGPVVEGACCLDHVDGPFCGGVMAMEYCTLFDGYWMGAGTACEDLDCADAYRGACCIWDHDSGTTLCVRVLPGACQDLQGVFAGHQTYCESWDCCTTSGPCRGYVSTGVVLSSPIPVGSQDDQWGVATVPDGSTSPGAAMAVSPAAHWDVDPDVRWLNATGTDGPPGETTYVCEFRIDLSVGTPVLDLFFAADDSAVVTLNDIVVLETDSTDAGLTHDILTTDPELFLDGCNTMMVHVENIDGPTGFQIAGLVALCRVGDIDGDGRVTVNDLLLILAAWGPCQDCPEDLDGDGDVDVNDLLALLGGWDP